MNELNECTSFDVTISYARQSQNAMKKQAAIVNFFGSRCILDDPPPGVAGAVAAVHAPASPDARGHAYSMTRNAGEVSGEEYSFIFLLSTIDSESSIIILHQYYYNNIVPVRKNPNTTRCRSPVSVVSLRLPS